jgi:Domain of unknown function (DUF5060)/Putative collagen-binding domain of a collagenase
MTGWIVPFALLLAACMGSEPAAVPRHGTAEIVLRAASSYDGAAGEPDPFDLEVTAQVVSPSGKRYTVPGFFDGDGEGGQSGRIFKVRVAAGETGVWRWSTSSGVPGLDGLSGTFRVEGELTGLFRQGPLVVSADSPRVFRRRDGGPVFLLGKFLDVAAPKPIQFSHTMLSERLSDADRQAMLDRHVALGLDKIDLYLANRGDYGGTWPTTPWLGTAAANDKRYFDLRRWRSYEEWVRRLRDAGLVAQLWFFADDSNFGALPDADRRRLMRYGMARLSAEVNTIFTLALEWQEGWTLPQVNADGTFLQERNPWSRLVSVHGVTGDFALPAASWVDYLDLQAGNEATPAAVHTLALANRALAEKPLIVEELGMGEEDAANRQKAWAAFLAGAAGVGTGASLANLGRFAARIPFAGMAPADGLALGGNAWVLAAPGSEYLVYLYGGGTVRLDLRAASSPLQAEWYDPRDGSSRPLPATVGGRVETFRASSQDDWVLYIHK